MLSLGVGLSVWGVARLNSGFRVWGLEGLGSQRGLGLIVSASKP